MSTGIALACLLLFGGQGSSGVSEWRKFPLESGLSASFPKAPSKEVLHKGSQEIRRYTVQFGMGVYRVAAYADTSGESARMREELQSDPGGPAVRGMLQNMIDACNAELKGKVTDTQFGAFKGHPMLRSRIETPHILVYVAAVCSEDKFVCLLAAQPRGAEDLRRIQRFFDSVEL